MKIAGIQKLSMVDYPGKMACTVFLPGCNLRCPYCHNSSLVNPGADLTLVKEEEVLGFLKKRQGLLDGVCITGGEPLLQGKHLIDFIQKIRELGYSVKLDTNGTFPDLLKELCQKELVDYVAIDIKNSWDNYHLAAGRCLLTEQIRESARFLRSGTMDYEFRTTLVKGIHTRQDIDKICKWMEGAKAWYLQNYRDGETILSPNSVDMEPFSENEIKEFEMHGKNQKINIFVRNV